MRALPRLIGPETTRWEFAFEAGSRWDAEEANLAYKGGSEALLGVGGGSATAGAGLDFLLRNEAMGVVVNEELTASRRQMGRTWEIRFYRNGTAICIDPDNITSSYIDTKTGVPVRRQDNTSGKPHVSAVCQVRSDYLAMKHSV